MGIRNVEAVYARWSLHLPHLPFRVLVWMAYRSLDADDPPRFWGGWEELAYAGGRMVPPRDDTDKDATRERAAASKAVRDAVRLLRERGAIRMTRRAAPGVNTDYSLNLFDGTGDAHRTASPVDNPAPPAGNGGRSPSPTVDGKRRNGGRSAFATVDAHRTPEEKEEEQDLPQERQGDLRTKPEVGGDPGSVDNPGSQPSEEGGAAQLALLARGGDDHNVCPECGVLLDPDRRCGHRTCPRYGSRP